MKGFLGFLNKPEERIWTNVSYSSGLDVTSHPFKRNHLGAGELLRAFLPSHLLGGMHSGYGNGKSMFGVREMCF